MVFTTRRARTGLLAVAVALAFAAPARALGDGKQLLSGGNSGSGASVRYVSPGLGNIYNSSFPGPGKGETAASLRMPSGTLSKLRVAVTTEGTASSGGVTVTVRLNGVDTALSCSVATAGGNCGDGSSVPVGAGDKLSIEVDSTLNAGAWAFTYSLLFD